MSLAAYRADMAHYHFAYLPVRLTDVHGNRYWTIWTEYWLGDDGVKYHCSLCDPAEIEECRAMLA